MTVRNISHGIPDLSVTCMPSTHQLEMRMAAMAVVPRLWVLGTVVTLDVTMLIGLVVYSYCVWRSDPNRIFPAGVTSAADIVLETPEIKAQ